MARPRRAHGPPLAGVVAGGLVALAVASVVLHPGADPASRDPSVVVTTPPEPAGWAPARAARGSAGRRGHHPPPLVCLDVDIDVLVGLEIGLAVGGHHHDCHPPPPTTTTSTTTTSTTTPPPPPPPPTTTTTPPPATTTSTTTTTTTVPPPPPPLPPPPRPLGHPAFVAPPPTTTTSTTSTTTTAPPPLPPAPLPPRITVSAAFDPHRPAEGQLATATLEVRNDGEGPADDLVLTDEVSRTTQLRSATSPDGHCTVAGRTVTCRLGRLAPGRVATVLVRVKVVEEPASSTLVQRVSLSTGGQVGPVERSFSALVDPGPPRGRALLDLPGPTVTLVALVTFVLAARAGPSAVLSGSR